MNKELPYQIYPEKISTVLIKELPNLKEKLIKSKQLKITTDPESPQPLGSYPSQKSAIKYVIYTVHQPTSAV